MTSRNALPKRFSSRAPLFILIAFLCTAPIQAQQPRLLVFSGQPAGVYHHTAIETTFTLLKTLAPKTGFVYDTTTNPALFTDANLNNYQAILMNCNCRHSRMFSQPQRDALQRFIRRGGGWAGTHCAAALDLDLNWDWYLNLLGAVHRHHVDGLQTGILRVDYRSHVSMTHFTANTWNISRPEELYFYLNDPAPSWRLNPVLAQVNVLMTFISWGNGQTTPPAGPKADSSHLGGLSWYHEYDGGRSWYTGLGHEGWMYHDSTFIKHLMGGLKYVLQLDGSTGFVGDFSKHKQGSQAMIRVIGQNNEIRHDLWQGCRVFDIQGNRLGNTDFYSHSTPFRMVIGVPDE